jgi:hypothetical protein
MDCTPRVEIIERTPPAADPRPRGASPRNHHEPEKTGAGGCPS